MEIKFGDIKIEVPYEKYLLKYGMGNPFNAMSSKSNQDFFNAFFRKAFTDYANYLEEYRKWMEKFANMSNPGKSEE